MKNHITFSRFFPILYSGFETSPEHFAFGHRKLHNFIGEWQFTIRIIQIKMVIFFLMYYRCSELHTDSKVALTNEDDWLHCLQIFLSWSKISFRMKKYANHLNSKVSSSVIIFYRCLLPVKTLNAYSLGDLATCFGIFWEIWELEILFIWGDPILYYHTI